MAILRLKVLHVTISASWKTATAVCVLPCCTLTAPSSQADSASWQPGGLTLGGGTSFKILAEAGNILPTQTLRSVPTRRTQGDGAVHCGYHGGEECAGLSGAENLCYAPTRPPMKSHRMCCFDKVFVYLSMRHLRAWFIHARSHAVMICYIRALEQWTRNEHNKKKSAILIHSKRSNILFITFVY